MSDSQRRPAHRRKPVLEALLADLAGDLVRGSARPPADRREPVHPPLLVVGCARSGTTLMLQWLAASGRFTYPTNFVSRFPTAPWVGARIQRLLTDPACDHAGELTLGYEVDPEPWSSRLGKTRGLEAPHEFWYWWRRFLPEGPTQALDDEQLAGIDAARMRHELAAWEAVTDRPLALKAMILDWNLTWLAEVLPRAVFVFVRRDPIFTMQSLLSARREHAGDESAWYSFRPPAFAQLRDLPPLEQVAAQVHHTEGAVTADLTRLPGERWLEVRYEDFCAAPAVVHDQLMERLARAGAATWSYEGPASFPCGDVVRGPAERVEALRNAWADAAAITA